MAPSTNSTVRYHILNNFLGRTDRLTLAPSSYQARKVQSRSRGGRLGYDIESPEPSQPSKHRRSYEISSFATQAPPG